ncbi:MAG: gas vesicle protein K [Phycisphaerales bacterium]|nr:gas vesicle protein K [Phycisphaerales bacterium]
MSTDSTLAPAPLVDAPLDLSGLLATAVEPQKLIDQIAGSGKGSSGQRLNIDPQDVRKGLGQLVMTVMKLLHEVLERQAVRRMEAGTLSDDQIERLGTTLMLQNVEIKKICDELGVDEKDLNMDLGPLGRLL